MFSLCEVWCIEVVQKERCGCVNLSSSLDYYNIIIYLFVFPFITHILCSNYMYSGSTPVRYSWVWQAFNFQRGHSFNIQCTAVLNSTRVVTFYVHAAFL